MKFPLRTLACSLGLLALTACGGDESKDRLNVLLVTLDTTRADRLGCYGYGKNTTPNLDQLAKDGARFERALSTAGITPMSHSSILTGLNNYVHGMRVFYSDEVSHRLKEGADTLPEILARRGYQTAACVSSYPVSEQYGLDQGFEYFEVGLDTDSLDLKSQQKHSAFWVEGGRLNTQRSGDTTVDDAVAWLDQNGESGPWCMWVHLFDVHDYSLVPPIEHSQKYGIESYPAGEVDGRSLDWRERMYDPEMAFQDEQIGRIFDWLREKDLYDSTIVVVTADHGQGLKDGMERHGWAKHRLLYDWSLHVPLLVKIPGETPGAVVDDQVRTIDIVPTLLDALDVPARQDMEGQSMVGLIRGEEEDEPRIAYADALNSYDKHAPRRGMPEHSRNEDLYMICDGEWKLIYHRHREQHELFHLTNDPLEVRNVASEKPEKVEELKAWLDKWNAFRIEEPGVGTGDGPDAATLKALGYTTGEEDEEPEEDSNEDEDE